MNDTLKTIATGIAGAGGQEVILQVTPDPEKIQSVIGLLGQIVIAIATVWSLIKKKKTANEVAAKSEAKKTEV